ncbi:hypothetical protein ACN9MZ_16915 [Pseudoduganella sp. S-14]|jgi:hypothetical protein
MKSAVATLLMLAAYALIAGEAAAQHPAFTDGVRIMCWSCLAMALNG